MANVVSGWQIGIDTANYTEEDFTAKYLLHEHFEKLSTWTNSPATIQQATAYLESNDRRNWNTVNAESTKASLKLTLLMVIMKKYKVKALRMTESVMDMPLFFRRGRACMIRDTMQEHTTYV